MFIMLFMSEGRLFEDKVRIAILMDFYGSLLAEKTQDIMYLSLDEDMSLAEIAEIKEISRQAVHDSIKRGEEHLSRYESALGFAKKTLKTRELVTTMRTKINSCSGKLDQDESLKQILDELELMF